VRIGEKIRYGRRSAFPSHLTEVEGMTNWWAATRPSSMEHASVNLDAGINAPASVKGSWARVPFLAIRSSPHKAGTDVTPWEDLHRPNNGYVRYFGDNKPGDGDWPHQRLGNRRMLAAWRGHMDADSSVRALSPPVLIFQGFTHEGRPKGQLIFNGVGVIDRAELVVQLDPKTSQTYTNYRFDLTVLNLARENDDVDWGWLEDRRNGNFGPSQTLRYAPYAWREWVRLGSPSLDRLRRNVLRAQVVLDVQQRPSAGTDEDGLLRAIYTYYTAGKKKHKFEALADFVTGRILEAQGIKYSAGWITRGSGDGGVDFVARIDLDPDGGFLSSRQVILGQAKCESLSVPTNGVHLARLVARLRRGWFGVFVTTSYFSRAVQREVLEDHYPLMLINGARLAAVVRQYLVGSKVSLTTLLERLDLDYDSRVSGASAEDVLYA
jgi:hypothetical protein